MLAIRLQRRGRKGHAEYRVVVQDAKLTPTSGRVVTTLGHYNPHSKVTTLDKEKAVFYLNNGAQPSDRVVKLLKSEGVTLPAWVGEPVVKQRTVRSAEKLRKNRPKEEAAPVEETTAEEPAEAPAEEQPAEAPAEDQATESTEAAVDSESAEESPAATEESADNAE